MIFYKLQALGNDFVVIFKEISHDEILKICHPKFGIGCDQLLILLNDRSVKMYNSDGSDVSFCGNGLRSLAYLQSVRTARKIFEFEVNSILYSLRVLDDGKVKLKMNRQPIFLNVSESLKQILNGITGVVAFNVVDIGNKNLAIFFNKLTGIDYIAIKNQIVNLGVFQDDVNISFNSILPDGNIKSTIIERGAGPTLSCGSGGLATVASALKNGLVSPGTVTVHQPGGSLIHEIASDYDISQTGEATLTFEGTYYSK